MTRNGKSNTFLLGRIYERTEQTAKILPVIQQDISDIKRKQTNDFYEIKGLKGRVGKIESTSLSCIVKRAAKNIFYLFIGKYFKP